MGTYKTSGCVFAAAPLVKNTATARRVGNAETPRPGDSTPGNLPTITLGNIHTVACSRNVTAVWFVLVKNLNPSRETWCDPEECVQMRVHNTAVKRNEGDLPA